MPNLSSGKINDYKNLVGLKFQLYNSLFTALPFHKIEKTGILLSLFLTVCEDGFARKQSPAQIIDEFFNKHTTGSNEKERTDMMFRFVQYVERQVVLFDALEDAAFKNLHDRNGPGSLKQLQNEVSQLGKESELKNKLENFSTRLVLTAHPTQFYPDSVLGIINDISNSLLENNMAEINTFLQQLGKTPFFKKKKPTPYDEAVSLVWYLEHIFYQAAGRIYTSIKKELEDISFNKPVIRMGFWPGGDRDGNPFVNNDITLNVAKLLREAIIKCYYLDVRKLKRRLTFEGVEESLVQLEKELYENIFIPGHTTSISREEILKTLFSIRETIIYKHNSLYLGLVDQLINRVQLFGLHFASLDIRQDSRMHTKVIAELTSQGHKIDSEILPDYTIKRNEEDKPDDSLVEDSLRIAETIREIQNLNGSEGCNRYVISQCKTATNLLEVYQLLVWGGMDKNNLPVEIVPLFETIDDLKAASGVMEELYTNSFYKAHLERNGCKQTIMLGFSDGTKDGGYMMANWMIYKAKEELTAIAKKYGVKTVFFDGRGGPPARGGGKTHKFYASMGKNISNEEIQLTVQGQTVSSNFGTIASAQYNIEQLLSAGISNELFEGENKTFTVKEEQLIFDVSNYSFDAYIQLRDHPYFLNYLLEISPLKYYSDTNIASRPTKRGGNKPMTLDDLRAIPFVGAWSQIKQNVTGYFGLGTALKKLQDEGRFEDFKSLYNHSLFIRTLMDNCEMAMRKCFFPLTEYIANHEKYGEIWKMIADEFELTKKFVLKLSGHTTLMESYPVDRESVKMRERIVLPLTTIQQYAIVKANEANLNPAGNTSKEVYEKLIMRCSFGIINAARNSA